MFSYNPLWKILVDKNMNKTDLRVKCNLAKQTMTDMSKNKYVSLKSLDKICNELGCKISDIIEHIPDNQDI